MLLSNRTPPVLTMIRYTSPSKIKSMATDRTTATSPQRRPMSAFEARVSLVLALASQASYQSQRLLFDLANETTKYLFPKRSGSRDLEEALMAVPDLETLKYKVSSRKEGYEIRELEPYFVAETTMSGETGFDFYGASQSFNVLADYLFGKHSSLDLEHDEGENGNDYACNYSQDPACDDQRGEVANVLCHTIQVRR
uniref:Uncharacterized protein n=1 Tax=Populus trichocarpa TaxID=3694 RepID=A0A3N7G2Y7_POPTR